MKGLILCGGESKRAGTDKGLKLENGKTWAEIMNQKLIDLGLSVKVSINSSQITAYENYFAKADLIIDDVSIPGPLRGILSAHKQFPDGNWMVLACDLIDMQLQTMKQLMESFKINEGIDFYVYKNEKRYQPFCGIYTANGLNKLLSTYQNKQEENYSMQHVFDSFKTYAIPIAEEDSSFKNYNK